MKTINIYVNMLLIFLYLFNFARNDVYLDYEYLTTLTLLNGKVLMITESNGILYDYELNSQLNTVTFDETISSYDDFSSIVLFRITDCCMCHTLLISALVYS